MNIILETICTILKIVYLLLKAMVLTFVPSSFRRKDITGEVVLVTGAGSGIGRRMAINFSMLGAKLVLWDIDEKGNKETADEIINCGGKAISYVCDLSSKEQIYMTADKVKRDMGDVTILVNNAGIVTGKKFLDCPDSLILKTMEVNTMAHFWTCKAFLPNMVRNNHGHLVNIASSAGLAGVNGLADYCASKFAAVGFDESLRFELRANGKEGVHTTVVCPFYINTGMFDGVKSRFPWILPVVDQDYAAERIVDGVLINQEMVYIPRILYFVLALKGIIPCSVGFELCQLLGINNVMDGFKGRQKKE